ncbi:MarR family winged helix-turn-helix transcriptional regulator [Cellulomonas sp. S1-8]|uniref:MarR family winged helix-turn-helix transcriptional regulator n=1 Tax=Cellulomonas sp. S1-8 TaxID=2904790 RepID=UPI002243DCED|nr:MarR family transcriptional regulator [Cellulomonas sp. S1-8]UZN04198.1 MarR family transcriptional regulator [Cellulomonas sp. S1-8]
MTPERLREPDADAVVDAADAAPADVTDAAVPWLSAEQQEQWWEVATLVMTLPGLLDAQLRRDAGVNLFEYHVLAALSEVPSHTLVLSDLAALARGSLSRLSHALTRLERAGYVTRAACTDRGVRRVEATLTAAGYARLERIAPGHVREVRRLVVDAITPEQLAALADASRAVNAAIDADPHEECTGGDAC